MVVGSSVSPPPGLRRLTGRLPASRATPRWRTPSTTTARSSSSKLHLSLTTSSSMPSAWSPRGPMRSKIRRSFEAPTLHRARRPPAPFPPCAEPPAPPPTRSKGAAGVRVDGGLQGGAGGRGLPVLAGGKVPAGHMPVEVRRCSFVPLLMCSPPLHPLICSPHDPITGTVLLRASSPGLEGDPRWPAKKKRQAERRAEAAARMEEMRMAARGGDGWRKEKRTHLHHFGSVLDLFSVQGRRRGLATMDSRGLLGNPRQLGDLAESLAPPASTAAKRSTPLA